MDKSLVAAFSILAAFFLTIIAFGIGEMIINAPFLVIEVGTGVIIAFAVFNFFLAAIVGSFIIREWRGID